MSCAELLDDGGDEKTSGGVEDDKEDGEAVEAVQQACREGSTFLIGRAPSLLGEACREGSTFLIGRAPSLLGEACREGSLWGG